jgi:Tol biopolymer transport system component
MPRIADALERESRSVELEPGDFERLLVRRERKLRNRRIREGVIAVLVTLATAAVLVRAIHFHDAPATPPKPIGAGEVLSGYRDILAHDPDSGAMRKIVDFAGLPARVDSITGAAWSHDHMWVAFRAGGLWVADAMGGKPRQLTADLGWSPWAWSPTEDQLVVVLGRDVTLIDAATGRETDLGTTAGGEDIEGYAVHALDWSPDGTKIAYDAENGAASVYSIDVGTGEHSPLVDRPAGTGELVAIDWSPDGSHLAMTYEEGTSRQALYLANADGSHLRLVDRVTASQWPVWHPGLSVRTAWSPDGAQIAYANLPGDGEHLELQVRTASVDGSVPSLVASHCCVSDGGAPVWSPNGSQIGFAFETGGAQPVGTPQQHLVVNADGTGDPADLDAVMYQSWAGGWYFCACYG